MVRGLAFWSVALVVVVGGCAQGVTLPVNGNDGGVITKGDAGGGNDSGNNGSDSGNNGSDSGNNGNCTTSPPSSVCGVYPQCGCSGGTCEVDQQKLDGSSSCVTAGSKQIGDACSKTAGECAQGLTCIFGVCRPYCGSDGASCSDPGTGHCKQLTQGQAQTPIQNLLVCSVDCSLTDPNSCGGGGVGCVYDSTNQDTDCYTTGTAMTCSSTTFCAPGYECIIDGNNNTLCKQWCHVNGSDCNTGTCTSLGTPVVVNGVEFGVCL